MIYLARRHSAVCSSISVDRGRRDAPGLAFKHNRKKSVYKRRQKFVCEDNNLRQISLIKQGNETEHKSCNYSSEWPGGLNWKGGR